MTPRHTRTSSAIFELLRGRLRTGDLLVRLGGDEFAVLLERTSVDGARFIAERMRRAIEESRPVPADPAFGLSISIGMVLVDGTANLAEFLSIEGGRGDVGSQGPGSQSGGIQPAAGGGAMSFRSGK